MKRLIGIFITVLLIGITFLPLVSSTDADNKIQIFNNLPDYFNWKDYDGQDWTTPAKDQAFPKYCGSCWAFAAVAALESLVNIRADDPELDMDLSEQYILSCLPAAGGCRGGNAKMAWYCIKDSGIPGNDCNGIIPEHIFPYQADDEIPCSNKSEDWEDHLIPISDFGELRLDGTPEDIEAIKSQIMQTGPVVASMLVTNDFNAFGYAIHNPDDYYHYPGPVDGTNHQVIVVGWRDDVSVGNGGYWICKNSHGTGFGYDGFFNIEYGSLNIDNSFIGWVTLFPTFLNCEGSVNLVDVKPGDTITNFFTVENIGSPFSNLEWEVIDWPDWGEWTFESYEGFSLTPEDGEITIDVSVVVPDEKNQIYNGHITVINKRFDSDYEIIPISITTVKNKKINTFFMNLLDNYPNLFFFIRQILNLQ
jgi:hypothetical protein